MNIKLMCAAAAVFFCTSASADNWHSGIDKIAQDAGVSPQQVMMVLGASSSYPEYRAGYWYAQRKVDAALDRLAADHEVQVVAVKAAAANGLAATNQPSK